MKAYAILNYTNPDFSTWIDIDYNTQIVDNKDLAVNTLNEMREAFPESKYKLVGFDWQLD